MTTCISDYLALDEDEMVTMLLLANSESDITSHLSEQAISRLDQHTQSFCDKYVDKHDKKPEYEEWVRVRVRKLRELLQEKENWREHIKATVAAKEDT